MVGGCGEKEEHILAQRFRDVVGSVIVLFDSLSTVVLAKLFPALSETISITLDPLESVLKSHVSGIDRFGLDEVEGSQINTPCFYHF